MSLWSQTHTWPFATRASAQTHLRVNRTADAIASYHAARKPEPRHYRIRTLKGRCQWPVDGGLMSVDVCYIVERCAD